MKKAVLAALLLVSELSSGQVKSRPPLAEANMEKLRWAVFGQECPNKPGDAGFAYARANCYNLRSLSCGARVGCLCQTDKENLNNEIAPQSLPDCAYRRVGVCRWRDAQSKWIVGVMVRPVGWTPPAGMTCVVISSRLLVLDSRGGHKDVLETDLQTKCGWPVEGDSWGCCPHCLVGGANGCPPCRGLCKYGNAWPGHEAECVSAP